MSDTWCSRHMGHDLVVEFHESSVQIHTQSHTVLRRGYYYLLRKAVESASTFDLYLDDIKELSACPPNSVTPRCSVFWVLHPSIGPNKIAA
eukprot:497169-Amphidinium_carterae.1